MLFFSSFFLSMKLFTRPLQRRELSVKYISKHIHKCTHTCMGLHAHANAKSERENEQRQDCTFLSCIQDPNTHTNTHTCTHAWNCMHTQTCTCERKKQERKWAKTGLYISQLHSGSKHKRFERTLFIIRALELCESRGGRPWPPSLLSLRFLSGYLFIMTKQHFVTIIATFYVFESCFKTLAVLVSAAFRLDFFTLI